MEHIICPVCGELLQKAEHALICPARHSFDIARQGYVNLLTVSQKKSLHPGDTRDMVAARRRFLDTGVYSPIAQAVENALLEFCPAAETFLDAGCGEGYYTARAAKAMPRAGVYGLDISKDAVRFAAGKYKNMTWLCGTAAKLPFRENTFDGMMSLFALTVPGEFGRVLKENGIFLQILAREDHLMGLKHIIYPEILHREKNSCPDLPGFTRLDSRNIDFSFTVEGGLVQDLLSMTPHLWRISREGAEKLAETQALTDEAKCVLNIFRKN